MMMLFLVNYYQMKKETLYLSLYLKQQVQSLEVQRLEDLVG
jgi:hypothetical protein